MEIEIDKRAKERKGKLTFGDYLVVVHDFAVVHSHNDVVDLERRLAAQARVRNSLGHGLKGVDRRPSGCYIYDIYLCVFKYKLTWIFINTYGTHAIAIAYRAYVSLHISIN